MGGGGVQGKCRGRGRTGALPGRFRTAVLAASLTVGATAVEGGGIPLAAQDGEAILGPSFLLTGGGLVRSDYNGNGSSAMYGLRLRMPLGGHLLIEPAVQYTTFPQEPVPDQADPDLALVVLDFQIQLQADWNGLRPYVGIGAGGAADFRSNRGATPFVVSTFTASWGVATDLSSRLILLSEVRLRSLDEFKHRALDVMLGLGLRL